MKVFWSWQSDLESKTHRNLIKRAIEEALKSLKQELDLDEADRLEIDHDTKGITGTVDISATIFNKIEKSFAFIADVTPITKIDDDKYVPNPNVMIEFGYALKSPGEQRVIAILNTAKALPKDLPFDLRGRRCMTYDCADDASKSEIKEAREKLSADIAYALKEIFKSPQDKNHTFDYSSIKAKAHKDEWIWEKGDRTTKYSPSFLSSQPTKGKLVTGPKGYFRCIPKEWKSTKPSLINYKDLNTEKRPVCPSNRCHNGSWGATSDGFNNFWFSNDTSLEMFGIKNIESITKYFEETGEIWSCQALNQPDSQTVAWRPLLRNWSDILSSSMKFYDEFGASTERYCEIGYWGLDELSAPADPVNAIAALPFRQGKLKLSKTSSTWNEDTINDFLFDALIKIYSILVLGMPDRTTLDKMLGRY